MAAQMRCNLGTFTLAAGGNAYKHMGFGSVTDAVIELGNRARRFAAAKGRQVAQQAAKPFEAAALFGNGHRQQRFAFFAHFGAFCHKPQAVEIHVRATQNSRVGLASRFVKRHIFFDGCYRHRAGGLDDAAGVDKHIFDGGAHRVGVDADVVVYQMPRHAKGFFTHQFHRRAIGKQTHIAQGDALARHHRLQHGRRIIHLHANHLHLRAHRLDVIGDTRYQTTATNSHKHRIQRALVLAQQFHGNRALAGNHFGVIKRMDKRQTLFGAQLHCVAVSVGVAVAVQQHFSAQRFDRLYLQCGRGHRHHNHRPSTQFFRAQGHALRMVASRRTHHAFGELRGAELHHLVVRAAQLKAKHRLLVFTFEQHLVVQAFAEYGRSV